MSFYKLESTYNTIPTARFSPDYPNYGIAKSKIMTYKYYIDSWNSLVLRMQNELLSGAKVAVRTISQAEYIRGLER